MSIVASQLIGLITIQGADESIAKVLGVGASFDAVSGGPLARLKNGFGNLAFGFRNLGVAGTIGMDAIKQGAAQVGPVLLVMGAVGAAALAALVAKTTDMAGNFQQGINRLRTGAGDVQDSFNTLANGIKQVAVDTGTATKPLIDAMYQILSAGQRGAQSLNTLSVAAEGAKIEQAKVVDVAGALTTAMTDYGTHTFNATQFMNGYIQAVKIGRITLEALSTSMGPLLPIAHDLGIHFSDVAAAMSTMTNAGLPADRAATSLRFLFQSLENPTKKAQTALKEFGVNSIALGNELKTSLPGALEMVYKAALKAGPEGSVPFNRAVSDMIGGQRSLSAYLALTGSHMRDFKGDAAAIAAAMTGSKTAVQGWATVQGNFNLQMDKAKASLEVLGITIGQALLPVMTKIVAAIAPIVVAFTNWLVKNNAIIPILGGLAALIGGVLVAALVSLVIAFWPVFAIGAALGVLVAGIILAVQHWGQIMSWIGGVFSGLGSTIHGWVSSVGSAIGGFFSNLGATAHSKLTDFKNTVGGAFSAAGTNIHNAITGWGQSVQNFTDWMYKHNIYWKSIVDNFPKALERVKGDIGHILGEISGFFGATFSAIGTFVHDRLVWIRNTVGAIFSAIGTFIHDRLTWIQGVVNAIWNWISSFIGNKANDAKTSVSNAFTGLASAVGGILGRFASWIGGFFGNLAGQAFQWGANIIQGIINGIGSMFSALGSAVSNVAGWISSHLGFRSPPKEGPARDADKWMPNMMAMFVQGIAAGTPNLRRALYGALGPMSTSLSVGTSFTGGSYLPGGISIPVGVGGYGGAPAYTGQPVIVQLNIGNQQFARVLMPAFVQAVRTNTGVVGM